MRVDNDDSSKHYKDFWEWLFDDWHIFFLVSVGVGYLYYLSTTREA